MNSEKMKRLLGLARECEVKGWEAMVRAHADLVLADEGDRVAVDRAQKLAREAKGFFKDAVSLLDEVQGTGEGL